MFPYTSFQKTQSEINSLSKIFYISHDDVNPSMSAFITFYIKRITFKLNLILKIPFLTITQDYIGINFIPYIIQTITLHGSRQGVKMCFVSELYL